MRFAAHEADCLGLDLGVFIGPAGCGGPWVTPENGQQELVWSNTACEGPGLLDRVLDRPGQSERGYYRDVALLALPAKGDVHAGDVLDISDYLDASGRLHWEVPEGSWTIYRFGQQPTGRNLFGELYIDHLSAEVFDRHWEHTVGVLLNEMTPAERRAFKYVECDSWEAGFPNWTKGFPAEFRQRRGYEMLTYLPVLAGRVIDDAARSAAFTRDYRLTISDLIADLHYAHQREVANRHGLHSYAEAAGPHQFQADLLKCVGRCDVAMGEFWMPSPHRPPPEARFLVRESATAAHIYGIKRVFAESFTSVGPNWEVGPFQMKAAADQAFCDGLNWICFHTFSHRPSLTDRPGLTHSAGTHFDRTITWWEQSRPFVDYLSRCSFMLQQGLFVADVLYYQGWGIRMGSTASPPITLQGKQNTK
ncbi:glycosyl hydrolase [Planctomycetota bacterium]